MASVSERKAVSDSGAADGAAVAAGGATIAVAVTEAETEAVAVTEAVTVTVLIAAVVAVVLMRAVATASVIVATARSMAARIPLPARSLGLVFFSGVAAAATPLPGNANAAASGVPTGRPDVCATGSRWAPHAARIISATATLAICSWKDGFIRKLLMPSPAGRVAASALPGAAKRLAAG